MDTRIILVLYLLMMIIGVNSCRDEYSQNDLPSDKLIDTLIRESINQSSIICFKTNNNQIDSFKANQKPYIQYRLYKHINTYILETKNKFEHLQNEFSNDYLLTSRFTKDNKNLFNKFDTGFISFQIRNSKRRIINEHIIGNLDLIDSSLINKMDHLLKTNKYEKNQKFRFNYIEFYTPLLNKKKNIAIIGASGYNYFDEYRQGFGNFIILERDYNRWKKIDEVMWWTN